jgi:pyruvate kinase
MIRARLHRHAKVVATLGPASSSVEMISRLILAGVNVARVNLSYGTHEGHAKLVANAREASRKVGLEIAILADLQGPKIRVAVVPAPLLLRDDEVWGIGPSAVEENYPEYKGCFIPTTYERLAEDCSDGARILFDDGLIIAEVVERDREVLKVRIRVGGELKSNKGINLPDSRVSAPSLTEKDRNDLVFGVNHDVDYVALSFVRKPEDVLELKGLLDGLGKDIPVVSKIENPEGIEKIGEIVRVTDVVMVARGDMGVELGNHLVPAIQKRIISLCNERGTPVITATQMLESMVHNAAPTRAEASDVANAIWDGTDAVMLSAETAIGRYPVQAVKMMGKIITEAEKTPRERPSRFAEGLLPVDDAIMMGAAMIAEKVGAKRIVSVTESGNSCLKMCRFRPKISVLGVSNALSVVRRMCLYWGVSPFYLEEYREDDPELERYVFERVWSACELERGDRMVITRGTGRFFSRGTSNSVRVETVK